MEDPRLAKIKPELFCRYHRFTDHTCFDTQSYPLDLAANEHPADVEGWTAREGFCKHRTGQYEETLVWSYYKEIDA